MIVCRVLGPVSLELDGGPAPAELLWRKHLALLVYLARSPKRSRTREHLCGLLWPDKEDAAARHSLNEALRVLRRATAATLESEAGQVRLPEGAVALDADQLEQRVVAADWPGAAAIVAGEFLEGFAVPGATGFEDWLATERIYWRERSLTALLGQSAALLAQGHGAAALSAARRAEALDPHSELAACALLTALAVQGEPAAALVHFERFAALLTRELGQGPSAGTRELAERIRASGGPRRPAVAREPAERRRAPLLGRERELTRLTAWWEGCRSGLGSGAALVEGEPGSGKTRLLQEFLARARLAEGTVVLLRAVEADAAAADNGLLGLARGGLLSAPGLPAAPARALAPFCRAFAEWSDRFPAAAADPDPLPPVRALGPLLDAALEGGPLLLVVDDAHWIDAASLLALLGALRDFPRGRLGLVLAAPGEPAREELVALRRRLDGDVPGLRVVLGPFDAATLRALAAWALPEYDPTALERVARRVASDSAGLPLLAVELLSAVAQGLDVHQGAAAWPKPLHTLTATLPGDLPDTVIAAIRIGFRRLSPAAQQTLAAASVLAEVVTESLLARATGLELDAVQGALDELEWQRWLEADARGYGFVARITRQVIARDMLTSGQRARLLERSARASA